jgi:hypothetical protein
MVGGSRLGGRTSIGHTTSGRKLSFHGKPIVHGKPTQKILHFNAPVSNSNTEPLVPHAPKKPTRITRFLAGFGIGRKSYATQKQTYKNYHKRLADDNAAEKARIASEQAIENARQKQEAFEKAEKAKPVKELYELYNKLNLIRQNVLSPTQAYKNSPAELLNVEVTKDKFGLPVHTYTLKPEADAHANKLAEIISKYRVNEDNRNYHNIKFDAEDSTRINNLMNFFNNQHAQNIGNLHNKALVIENALSINVPLEYMSNSQREADEAYRNLFRWS